MTSVELSEMLIGLIIGLLLGLCAQFPLECASGSSLSFRETNATNFMSPKPEIPHGNKCSPIKDLSSKKLLI
jgi:hypothetical protein